MSGSKFIVFGGQVDGEFMNDLWAFDLNSRKCWSCRSVSINLHLLPVRSTAMWELYEPTTSDRPAQRTGHVCVAFEDQILM